MESSVVAQSNKAAVGVGITFPVERLNLYMKLGSQGVQDVNAIFDIGETFNATMPVERHLNTWLGIGSEREAWCANIAKNSHAIHMHLESVLGTNAQLRLPRTDRLFGFGSHPDSMDNGYDKLDQHLASVDHLTYVDSMVHNYSVVF